jgi:hypothetical protein
MCFLAAPDKPEKYPIILPFLALRIYTGSMLTLYCYPDFLGRNIICDAFE